jgi:hypothetical protein
LKEPHNTSCYGKNHTQNPNRLYSSDQFDSTRLVMGSSIIRIPP